MNITDHEPESHNPADNIGSTRSFDHLQHKLMLLRGKRVTVIDPKVECHEVIGDPVAPLATPVAIDGEHHTRR